MASRKLCESFHFDPPYQSKLMYALFPTPARVRCRFVILTTRGQIRSYDNIKLVLKITKILLIAAPV